jgi:hypothetical protein
LVVDGNELESAFWFDRKHLSRIPEKISSSRALIARWIDQGRGPGFPGHPHGAERRSFRAGAAGNDQHAPPVLVFPVFLL